MSELRHDVGAALAFLRLLYPEGPWLLVAIDPNDPEEAPPAKTFRPGGERELARWLDANAPKRNIYYHVNVALRDMAKKAHRTDIREMPYLHVDADPRAGEPFLEEQARIRKLFGEGLPAGVPRPSIAVWSGGGLNALWRLEDPIQLGGVLEAAEQAKRYNLQLEILLGGDNCHNVDRILRLPGTVNWPNAKKRAKGRVPVLAELMWAEPTAYPLGLFTAAPMVQAPGGGGLTARPRVVAPGNVRRLQSLDELPEAVKGKVKEVIIHGTDLDDPGRWPSRSEPLYWVTCELIRGGTPDDVIFSVLTDPDFAISKSVLDKGSSAEAYALRQLEQAHEEAVHPALREMNAKHAVIGNLGGKCRVVEELEDPGAKGRRRLTKQSFDDFRNRYLNRRVEIPGATDRAGNPVRVPLGKWWLEHEQRKTYETIVFSPERDVAGAYNLWRGFACQAIPGVAHEGFLTHVRENVCSGNAEHYDYLLRWMALAVQKPARPGEVAVVLRGRQGTGKGVFAKIFGSLWGQHFLQVSDPKHLTGSFNAHLRDCVVLFGDEAFFAGDKKHESVLKTLITEENVMIEGKGVDAEWSPNYTHLIMASNSTWVVPAGTDERRYFVLDVAPTRAQDHAYFKAIRRDMESGGNSSLLHYLLNLDVSEFNVRAVPKTEALREQKLLSLSPEEEWWYRKLEDGVLVRQHIDWAAPVLRDELLGDYLLYTTRVGVARRATATALGRFLRRALPNGWPRGGQRLRTYSTEDGTRARERAYYYDFPSLETCRAHWDEAFFAHAAWPEVIDRNEPGYEAPTDRKPVF